MSRKTNLLSTAALLAAVILSGCFNPKTIIVENQDLTKIRNGSYTGEYEMGPVKAHVRVKVENNRIAGIDILERRNGLGKKAESITNKVIEEQSVEVDAVSGATLSSKVILKAIESALKGKAL